MAKSEKLIHRPVNRSWRILLVTNILLGLLLFQAVTRANDAITSQVADNDTGEFYTGTLMPVPEADVRAKAVSAESDNNILMPETAAADDASQHIVTGAATNDTIAESKDGYINAIHESKLALPVPTKTELPPGYQQVIYPENADNSSGDEEYRYIVRYVDREVVKEVPVEKPVELREFTSLEELKAWLAEDDTDEFVYLFASKNGVCQQNDRYDCDDYAFQLQKRAASCGFLISVTIINSRGMPHMINLAGISNNIYYIEPQSDKVWFYCNRD